MTIRVEPLLLLRNPDGSYALDLASIGIAAWQPIALFAPWESSDVASGFLVDHTTPAYYKDPFGVVHLQGTATPAGGGSSAAALAQLPVGYRPGVNAQFAVAAAGIGTDTAPLNIAMDGTITPNRGLSQVALDVISFRAA